MAFVPPNPVFDPIGGPQVPPAVAARRRKDQKRDTQRKIGAQVMDQVADNSVPAASQVTPTPPPPAPVVPSDVGIGGRQAGNDLTQPQFPSYQTPQYHEPAKGLEYLAAGLGILFPGSPLSKMAGGFAAGLQQRSENRYARDTQNAQLQYQSQVAAFQNQQTEKEQEFLKTLGPPPERKKDEPEDQYQAELAGYYDKATVGALQAGLPDLASKLSTIQTHAGTAGLNVARTGETESRIPLNDARAKYYQNVLKVNLQEVREKIQASERNADEQTRARMSAAGEAASSRIQVAEIGANSRQDVAQLQDEARLLGQYYAINARSADQAAKLAADRVNSAQRNAEAYAAAYGKATGNWNLQGGQPQVPGASIVFSPTIATGQPQQPQIIPLGGGKFGMVVNGQVVPLGSGSQPPPGPKPQAPQPQTQGWAGALRAGSGLSQQQPTVTRTGNSNGRKVFQLSDGSVHYDSPTGPIVPPSEH